MSAPKIQASSRSFISLHPLTRNILIQGHLQSRYRDVVCLPPIKLLTVICSECCYLSFQLRHCVLFFGLLPICSWRHHHQQCRYQCTHLGNILLRSLPLPTSSDVFLPFVNYIYLLTYLITYLLLTYLFTYLLHGAESFLSSYPVCS